MSSDSSSSGGGEEIEELPEGAVEEAADRVIDRLQESDDFDLSRIENKAIDISRRQVLGAVAAAGIGGGIIGSSGTAQAAGEDFTNATGTVGTDSKPLQEANVKNLHSQSGTITDLDADRFFSRSRLPQVSVHSDGTTVTADGPDGKIDEGPDGASVLQTVHDNFPTGVGVGWSGDLPFSSTLNITNPNMVFVADSMADKFRATTSLSSLVSTTGLAYGPRFFFGTFDGAGNADRFIKGDSTAKVRVKECSGTDFNTEFALGTGDASGRNPDFWAFENVDVGGAPKFATAKAGSNGFPTDWFVSGCSVAGPTMDGWGLEFVDCQDMRVENFFAGSNQVECNGAIRIEASGSAGGAPVAVHGTVLENIAMENQIGGSSAATVEFDATGDLSLRECEARGLGASGDGTEEARALNSSGTIRRNRGVRIGPFLNVPNSVTVGPDVLSASVVHNGEKDQLRNIVTDNGDFTTLNGHGRVALGGSAPTESNWEVGNVVEDSDNAGDAYLILRSGSTQIGT